MLLRIRSPDGTFRIEVQPDTSGEDFTKKILEIIPGTPDLSQTTVSNKPAGGEVLPIVVMQGRTVKDMGFGHGDMIFLNYKLAAEESTAPEPGISTPTPAAPAFTSSAPQSISGKIVEQPSVAPKLPTGPSIETQTVTFVDLNKVEEDEVDTYWRTQDGKIQRGRDEKMCRHGSKGMCDYCMPLEPFDSTYQAAQEIKHLSFHSYLRKLQSGVSASAASSSYLPPLTPLDYRVSVPCASGTHPSWPAGICSKCQPSAITLQSQPFRMIDHVEFSSPTLIDKYLEGWRKTGSQRFGLLVGRFAKYETVPMGIKAVVEAIHEVAQEGEVDGLTLGENFTEEEERVQRDASLCMKGLQVVGMVYTDLSADTEDKSKVLYKRHAQSFYLSSLETIFSAQQQHAHPTPSKFSPTGKFSSRFVTCVLTGSKDGGVEPMAFQVTEQAVAMVEADMIEASVDPGTVRVKREEKDRYVPDVFYSYKNEYGIQVKNSAKPCFPVEYLLVNLTHGFPNESKPLFLSSTFPIENRPGLAHQSIDKVAAELKKVYKKGSTMELDELDKVNLATLLSDWHLFSFLTECGIFEKESELKVLGRATIAHETQDEAAIDALVELPGWKSLLAIMDSVPDAPARPAALANDGFEEIPAHLLDEINGGGSGMGGGDSGAAGGGGTMACPHCTFENPRGQQDCEVCGLPLSG